MTAWVLLIFTAGNMQMVDQPSKAVCREAMKEYAVAKCIETQGWPGQIRSEFMMVGKVR
jgi:hypothetical protein